MTTSKKRNQKRLLKCGLLAAFLVIPAGVAAACGSPASLKYMTMVAKWDKMFSFQNENSEPAYLRNTSVKTTAQSSGSSSSSSGASTTTNQSADTTASTTLKYLKNAASGETPINELYAYDGTKSELLTTTTAAGAALNNIYSVLAQTFAYSLAAPAATYAAAVDAKPVKDDATTSSWMFPVNAASTTGGTTTTDGKNDAATLKDFYRAVANNLFVANSDTNIGFAVTDVSFSFKLIDDASSGSSTGTSTGEISNLSAKATTSTQTEATTTASGTSPNYSLITSLGSPFDARVAFTSKALTTIDSKIKTKDKNQPQSPTTSDTSTTTTAYSDVDAQGWLTKTYLIDDASVYFRFYLAGSDEGTGGLTAYPERRDIVQGAGGTSNSDATVDQVWNNAYGTKDKPSKPSAYAFKLQFNPLVAIMPYQILRAPETTPEEGGSTTTTPPTTTDSTPQYSLQPLAVTGVYPLELIKAEGLTSELLKVTQKVDAMMTVDQTTQFNTMSALAQADFSAFSSALTTTALRTAYESTSAAEYKPTGNINDSKTKTNTMREWFKWYFKGVYGLSPVNESDKPFVDPQPDTTSTPTT